MARGLLEDFRWDPAGGYLEDRITGLALKHTRSDMFSYYPAIVKWEGENYTMDNT